MNRLLVGVAILAATALLVAVGLAGVAGSTRSNTKEAATAGCAASHGTDGGVPSSAPLGGIAGTDAMPWPAGSRSQKSMEKLKDRLARTPSGGTLTVQPGVYRGTLVIDHPVTLVGIGHPILQGDGTGTVLTIRAAGTTVRDLMVEGSGPGPVGNPAGVSVAADNVVVKDLHIRDTYTGIWVEGVSDARIIGNVIEGRKTLAVREADMAGMRKADMAGMRKGSGHAKAQVGRGDGVSLFNATRPRVAGNTTANVRDGVYLSFGSGARIECNSIVGSRYAIHSMYGKSLTLVSNFFANNLSGAVMMYAGPVTLEGNVIRDHYSASTGFGVLILEIGAVRFLRNLIVSNRVGLQIEGPKDDPRPTAVELNTIALNQVGVALYPTAHAVLSQNSLVENTVQVLGLGSDGAGGDSRWSRGGVGNYWSDYRGFARSGRGVGEIPHVEGAAASRLLARDPTLLALASSPAFMLLRAVEQRSVGQRPVSVDRFPLVGPKSPSLPSAAVHATLGTGLVGVTSLVVCSLVLLRYTRRRQLSIERERT